MRAQKIGKYQGRQYYRVPVEVHLNDSRMCATLAKGLFWVIAPSAADAANLVRDEWSHRPETEIVAYGPKGGEARRYVGWYSCIGAGLFGGNIRNHSLQLEG